MADGRRRFGDNGDVRHVAAIAVVSVVIWIAVIWTTNALL